MVNSSTFINQLTSGCGFTTVHMANDDQVNVDPFFSHIIVKVIKVLDSNYRTSNVCLVPSVTSNHSGAYIVTNWEGLVMDDGD